MSSASPSKEPEVEHDAQSGDDHEQMEKDQQHSEAHGQGEFEVKEQDRWLPIANGQFSSSCSYFPRSDLRVPYLAAGNASSCIIS